MESENNAMLKCNIIKKHIKCMVCICCLFIVMLLFSCNLNNNSLEKTNDDMFEDVLTESERKSDMVMWYDCDVAPRANEDAASVWFSTYEEAPYVPSDKQQHRSATPLLGLYNQMEQAVARHHFYWI